MTTTILVAVGFTVTILLLLFLIYALSGAMMELRNIRSETTVLVALTSKYMQDQQQIANLFTQFIYTLNHFTDVVDDFTMMNSMDESPFFGESMNEMLSPRTETPTFEELSEEESKILNDLISKANMEEEEEEDEDGETQ